MSVISTTAPSPLATWLSRFDALLSQCADLVRAFDAIGQPPPAEDEQDLIRLLALRRSSNLPDASVDRQEIATAANNWTAHPQMLARVARHLAEQVFAESNRAASLGATRGVAGLATIPGVMPQASMTVASTKPGKDSPEQPQRFAAVNAALLPQGHPLRSLKALWDGLAILPSVPGEYGGMAPIAWFSVADVERLTQEFIAMDQEAHRLAQLEHAARHEQERRRQWLARPPEQRLALLEDALGRQQPELLRDKPEFAPDPAVVALLEQTRRRQQEAAQALAAEREREAQMAKYLASAGK